MPVARRESNRGVGRSAASGVVLLVVGISLAIAADVAAEELATSTPGQKALRGAVNLSLGLVVEWPKTIYYEAKKQGPLVGIPAGFLAGFGLGLMRSVVGAYELLTFPIELPDHYKPILTPPFPFEQGQTRVSPALIERPKEPPKP
jgi:putative exosortase-associated protein (TIGR04073 family)